MTGHSQTVLDYEEPPAGHALLVCSSAGQRLASVAAWTATGLRRGEKVLCTGMDLSAFAALLERLRDRHGLDSTAFLGSGQLTLAAPEDIYPPEGQESVVVAALAEGYPGVRITGTGEQALMRMSRAEFAEVEAQMNALCARYPLSALCQYDSQAVRDDLTGTLAHHPIVTDATATVAAGGAGAGPDRERLGMRLGGEFDLCNADLLGAAVARAAQRVPASGTLTLDLAELPFIGVAAVRTLIDATEELRDRSGVIEIRGLRRNVAKVVRLLGLDQMPGIQVEDEVT